MLTHVSMTKAFLRVEANTVNSSLIKIYRGGEVRRRTYGNLISISLGDRAGDRSEANVALIISLNKFSKEKTGT